MADKNPKKEKIKNYLIEKQLGEGGFGTAFLCTKMPECKKYVVKRINYETGTPEEQEGIKAEAKTMEELQSEYVIKYIESFFDKNKFYLATEYCSGGDLETQIELFKNNKQKISEDAIMRFFIQILLGLKHIHDKGLIHRDLKPENIFLDQETNVKIGDLGLAKSITSGYAKTYCGTQMYMAPEIFKKNPEYGRKADIWALGCILYEMTSLEYTFEDVQKILKSEYKPLPEKTPEDIKRLVSWMLNLDYDKRPYVDDLLKDEYVVKKAKSKNINLYEKIDSIFNGGKLTIEIPKTPNKITMEDKNKLKELKEQKKNIKQTISDLLHEQKEIKQEQKKEEQEFSQKLKDIEKQFQKAKEDLEKEKKKSEEAINKKLEENLKKLKDENQKLDETDNFINALSENFIGGKRNRDNPTPDKAKTPNIAKTPDKIKFPDKAKTPANVKTPDKIKFPEKVKNADNKQKKKKGKKAGKKCGDKDDEDYSLSEDEMDEDDSDYHE